MASTEHLGAPPPELDPIIHAPARLRIVVTLAELAPGDRLSFPRLQKLLGMTAGNLSTHLSKLAAADYVAVTKTFNRRTPVTFAELTPQGRIAYDNYLQSLRTILTPSATVLEDEGAPS